MDEGASLRLHLVLVAARSRALQSCVVVTPQKKTVELAPAGPGPTDRVKYDQEGGSLDDGWCGLRVDAVQAQDMGVWVLRAVIKQNGEVHLGKTSVTVFRE